MFNNVHLAGLCALLSVAGAAEARAKPVRPIESPPAGATLVLVDDMMVAEERDDADWRLSTDAYDRADDGDLRLRVKLRPNRAMGRMKLSF